VWSLLNINHTKLNINHAKSILLNIPEKKYFTQKLMKLRDIKIYFLYLSIVHITGITLYCRKSMTNNCFFFQESLINCPICTL
jgi:hypothetical protein